MNLLTLLLSKKSIYIVIAAALFGFGAVSIYYLKYRPVRNEVIALRTENKELQKQLKTQKIITDAIWANYYELAKLPRYDIRQDLKGLKAKRGSNLYVAPSATISDSIKAMNEGDSIIISTTDSIIFRRKPSFLERVWKAIKFWE